MNSDSEIARAKWLLFGVALFLVGSWISYRELAYALRGRNVLSNAATAHEVERRGRFGLSAGTKTIVDYDFIDADGNRRTGQDTMGSSWQMPESGQVLVSYTPGSDGSSRIAGHANWMGMAIFGISLIYLSIAGYRLWNRASEAVNGPKSKYARGG